MYVLVCVCDMSHLHTSVIVMCFVAWLTLDSSFLPPPLSPSALCDTKAVMCAVDSFGGTCTAQCTLREIQACLHVESEQGRGEEKGGGLVGAVTELLKLEKKLLQKEKIHSSGKSIYLLALSGKKSLRNMSQSSSRSRKSSSGSESEEEVVHIKRTGKQRNEAHDAHPALLRCTNANATNTNATNINANNANTLKSSNTVKTSTRGSNIERRKERVTREERHRGQGGRGPDKEGEVAGGEADRLSALEGRLSMRESQVTLSLFYLFLDAMYALALDSDGVWVWS